MSDSVISWLSELGLAQYADSFSANDVDLETLAHLTTDDLKELGVASIGHRRRLLDAIAELVHANEEPKQQEMSEEYERRHLTVAFVDMVGSTAMVSQCTPEQMSVMFRDFFNVLTEVVERFEGHEANRLGDGSMLFFGFPTALEDAAVRAVLASITLCREMSERVRDPLGNPVQIRIGIASGIVVVNRVDEKNTFGDTLNIAARIEGLANPGSIALADSTAFLVRDQIDLVAAGEHALKGISGQTQLWQLASDEASISVRPSPVDSWTTAGRDAETAALRAHWQSVEAGKGRVVALCGDAGIGKSHLAASFLDEVHREGAESRNYVCSPYHVNVPFHPLIRELTGAEASEPDDDDLAAAVRQPGMPESKVAQRERRDALIHGFTDRAVRPTVDAPSIISIDDLHWADNSSIETFEHIVAATHASGSFTIITSRNSDLARQLGVDEVIELGPLSIDDASTIIAAVAGIAPDAVATDLQVQAAAERSDGVPMFAIELGHSLASATSDGTSEPYATLPIPQTLRDGLESRIDRLKSSGSVLRLAAAIGREAPIRILRELSGNDDAFAAAATELRASALVDEQVTGTTAGEPCLVFRHQLVLDCAYDTMLERERLDIHDRIATLLVADDTAEPHILAYHLQQAERFEESSRWWALSGDIASSRFGEAEAAAHYERALALVPRHVSKEEAAEFETDVLLRYLPSLISASGYVDATNASVDRVVKLTRQQNKPDAALKALFLRWLNLLGHGSIDAAHRLSQSLDDLVEQCRSEIATLMLDRMLGTTHMFRGEHGLASAALDRFALTYSEADHATSIGEFGATHNESTVQCCRICITALRGDADESQRLQDLTTEKALQLGTPHNMAHVLAYGGACAAALVGDWPAMADYARQLDDLAEIHQLPFWQAIAAMYEGITMAAEGAHGRSQDTFNTGAGWFRSQGASFLVPTFQLFFVSAAADGGQPLFSEVLGGLDNQLDDGERWVRPQLFRLRGVDALTRGNTELSRTYFDAALALATEQQARRTIERINAVASGAV